MKHLFFLFFSFLQLISFSQNKHSDWFLIERNYGDGFDDINECSQPVKLTFLEGSIISIENILTKKVEYFDSQPNPKNTLFLSRSNKENYIEILSDNDSLLLANENNSNIKFSWDSSLYNFSSKYISFKKSDVDVKIFEKFSWYGTFHVPRWYYNPKNQNEVLKEEEENRLFINKTKSGDTIQIDGFDSYGNYYSWSANIISINGYLALISVQDSNKHSYSCKSILIDEFDGKNLKGRISYNDEIPYPVTLQKRNYTSKQMKVARFLSSFYFYLWTPNS